MQTTIVRLAVALIIGFIGPSAAAEEITYLKAGQLFDSRSGKVTSNAIITIVDDKIVDVGGSNTSIPEDANVIDLSDSFVMPGLMDMHTHVVGNLDPYFFSRYFQSPHRATIGGVVNAEKTLLAGFTTIRNVGASDYADVAVRNAINAGEIPGPRMAVSGPGLGITGGHCDNNSLNASFEERSDGAADVLGLIRVGRSSLHHRFHGTEPAAASALVPEHHDRHGRLVALPAFPDVGAARLFANRVQLELAQ